MKLNLHKKTLKQLSLDREVLPNDMTPQVAGGSEKYVDYIRLYTTTGGGSRGCNGGGSDNCQSDDGASA